MNSKEIKVLFGYTESLIPKRCRIARPVEFEDGELTVRIPMVTKKDAPVAIIKNRCWDQPKSISYRWWGKKLWVHDENGLPDQINLNDYYQAGINQAFIWSYSCVRHISKREAIKNIKTAAAEHLLIDGDWYKRADEPRYVVMTFGLGRNHGGTSLSWDSHYNPNIGKSRYFNLLQRNEAIELATQIAKRRGDDESLPIHAETFQVLIKEAIKVNPAKQHGNGDPFISSLDALSEAVGGNNAVVGAAAICMALA